MSENWLQLTPRETAIVTDTPVASSETGENTMLLCRIQMKVDRVRNAVCLTDAECRAVRRAKRHWQDGHERQFTALCSAMDRHLID